jgi:hypothetical protein
VLVLELFVAIVKALNLRSFGRLFIAESVRMNSLIIFSVLGCPTCGGSDSDHRYGIPWG